MAASEPWNVWHKDLEMYIRHIRRTAHFGVYVLFRVVRIVKDGFQ